MSHCNTYGRVPVGGDCEGGKHSRIDFSDIARARPLCARLQCMLLHSGTSHQHGKVLIVDHMVIGSHHDASTQVGRGRLLSIGS